MKLFKRIVLIFIAVGLIGLSAIYLINNRVQSQSANKIQESITAIPIESPPRVAIVLGAKVWQDGRPSNVLYDRVVTAVELYRAGRVKKILMSGDFSGEASNEPAAMKKTAVDLGVPESDVIGDYAGLRTYATCQRAKEIFGVERAIIVTQRFHQARTVYLCNNLGVESIGITADRRTYDGEKYFAFREFFSTVSAWFEINFSSPVPLEDSKQTIIQ